MALGVGLVLLALACALVLTRSPQRVVRGGLPEGALVASTNTGISTCQAGEVLPAGVSAVRLSVWAFFGTNVHVTVSSGSHVLTSGSRGPAWTGSSVTVPITPLHRAVSPVKVCFRLGPTSEVLYLQGGGAPPSDVATGANGEPLGGKLNIEYLAPGHGSWWSRILQVSRRLGLGHALTGTWVALLIFALMAATGVLAVRLVLRELT